MWLARAESDAAERHQTGCAVSSNPQVVGSNPTGGAFSSGVAGPNSELRSDHVVSCVAEHRALTHDRVYRAAVALERAVQMTRDDRDKLERNDRTGYVARADLSASSPDQRRQRMATITTTDGTQIFYKDWGSGQPIVFSHGWPLSSDDWDTQMLFFVQQGYRVIAHDRRGHGRSTQTGDGHDMDHYADDLAALTGDLELEDAIHVGHSTGGGEVVRYIARHGESRVAKAVLISAVPPLMVQTGANPGGLPKSVFDDLQAQLAANRSEFYRALPSGPFYGFNRPGAKPSEAIIENWWRQGMMGGAKAHYDGIVAFSQTDFTEDLGKITVPVLVMHGDDDQIVPYADSGPLSAQLVQNGTLKTYKGFPHGMPTTEAETINADLLAFLRS
jgi:non-heme chloroperoxidase